MKNMMIWVTLFLLSFSSMVFGFSYPKGVGIIVGDKVDYLTPTQLSTYGFRPYSPDDVTNIINKLNALNFKIFRVYDDFSGKDIPISTISPRTKALALAIKTNNDQLVLGMM